ncbi:hypothetical protein NDU88_004737 [Pleurodeles waltl]|uniref:NEDD4-binding protein 3 n=1 Tax=Pleurodeles waltl TaxID=8319 RepID=A0AAV7PEX4_PLEWA|nr:hypothetical protein NDU88_004737 [Pleurodeles waltl]
MATAQTCHVTYDPGCLRDPVSYQCAMGSVGSLIEKQDFVDDTSLDRRFPQGCRQPGPNKGGIQREVLSYLNITKKDWKSGKKLAGGLPFRREHSVDERENGYPSTHCRDRQGTNFTKTSLPERGRYDKPRINTPSFKPIGVKNFFSMENLSPSSGTKLSHSQNSLSTPVHRGPLRATQLHTISQDEREEEGDTLSDSGPCSVNSVPCYTPASGTPQAPLSASTGHLSHIGGSLDRAMRGSGEKAPCRSMAVLNRLYSAGDPPPPYEYSRSLEDMVQQLEEQLQQRGVEAQPLQQKEVEKQPRQRSPSGKEDPFAQVCENKRQLWMEELEELKQMYVLKLHQVSQQALRSQRILQLQLYKVQQEKKRLQDEMTLLRTECEELKHRQAPPRGLNPKQEEAKWEVSQKAAEISLLKQQLRDSQAELAQKTDEVSSLKAQLQDAKALVQKYEVTAASDAIPVSPKRHWRDFGPPASEHLRGKLDSKGHVKEMGLELATEEPQGFASCETDDSKCRGLQGDCVLPVEVQVERLQAALRLERRQSEALLGAFEMERRTWKQEKERVLKYQREIQTGYMEMYHRSQALERELQDIKRLRSDSISPTSLWMGQVDSSDT